MSNTAISPVKTARFEVENQLLREQVAGLKHQLDWFKRQMFGQKSEKRLIEPNPDQLGLLGNESASDGDLPEEKQTITYQDQQIQDLSDMVSQQWTEIDRLKKRLAQAKQRLEILENPAEEGGMIHEKPPHY
ncbi:MAG: hypothetical protein COB84_04360 [Rhodobacteraceae bacterium]|nr:MAG: hypothetical protein COB84_04360 [Paracoccaceae bacterium]